MSRTTLASILAALTLVTAAGCSSGQNTPGADTPTASPTTPTAPVRVTDAWARAVPELGDMPMTGVFATLQNTTGSPVTIVSATNSLSPVTEIHETVTANGRATMQKVDGGLTIEPGATRELRPGGDHVMVMKMTQPLTPGRTVTVTLTTQDGQQIAFDAVAKTFTGGDEKYHSGSTGTTSPSPASPAATPNAAPTSS